MAEPVGASDGAGCAAVRRMSYRPSHWPLVRTLDTVAVDVGAGLRRVPRFVGCDASLLAVAPAFPEFACCVFRFIGTLGRRLYPYPRVLPGASSPFMAVNPGIL